jgi:NTE family protein
MTARPQPGRALVLGGGGPLGVAWETGLVAALLDRGVELRAADLTVGTSAGSVVGSQLTNGVDFHTIMERLSEPVERPDSLNVEPDLAIAGQIFQKWASTPDSTDALRAEIGALAVRAKAAPEEAWLGVFEEILAGLDWPSQRPPTRLAITGVDTATGEFVVWERTSGVPLARAVASSCTIPGLFPPVSIDGSRFIDGGVRSFNNADLAKGHERVIVLSPFGWSDEGMGAMVRQWNEREIALLEREGSAVELVLPDAATQATIGPHLLDATKVPDAVKTGYAHGEAIAGTINDFWSAS